MPTDHSKTEANRSNQPKPDKNEVVLSNMNLPPAGGTRRAQVQRSKSSTHELKRRAAMVFVDNSRKKMRPNRPNLGYWLKQITNSYAKHWEENNGKHEQNHERVLDVVAQRACPFCGSEMQADAKFCWNLQCDMSAAFTPDGHWGEDINGLKSHSQTSNLLALDEQPRIKWIGETSLGYGTKMTKGGKGVIDPLLYRWHSWGRGNPEQHPSSKAALALLKVNSTKVTSSESRALKHRATDLMRRHASEPSIVPALANVVDLVEIPVKKKVEVAEDKEAAQHQHRDRLGATPHKLELERMQALRASHPLSSPSALFGVVLGGQGPFLVAQDHGAPSEGSQLERLTRQRREQRTSAISGSFSGRSLGLDGMHFGMRDGNFLPQHVRMMNPQMQAKFAGQKMESRVLRGGLARGLPPREDMNTAAQLQRELRFRQQHEAAAAGQLGRFHNLMGTGTYSHSVFAAPNLYNKRSLEALQHHQHQQQQQQQHQQNIAFQRQQLLADQIRRQKMFHIHHQHRQQLENSTQSRVADTELRLRKQVPLSSEPSATLSHKSQPHFAGAVPAGALKADSKPTVSPTAPPTSMPAVIDIS